MNFKKIGTAAAVLAGTTLLLLTSCAFGGTADKPGKNINKPVEEPASIVGMWEQIDPATGKPSSALRGNLVFEEGEKTVTGNDGCNSVFGGFSVKGSDVKFDGLASTMMFCEGVDTIMGTAATGKFTDEEMKLQDEDGKEIATLVKVEKFSEVEIAEIPADEPSDEAKRIAKEEAAPVKEKDVSEMNYDELVESGVVSSTTDGDVIEKPKSESAPTPDPNALGPGATTI